jgi:phosphoribosylanthranilate isomerase
MIFIKVCGITSLEDALGAIDAGADALGFNFYPPSPRYIAPEDARGIIEQLPSGVLTVGVFVNEALPETVAQTADETRVGAVQLHGDESTEYCHALRDYYVIKALRVEPGFSPASAQSYDVKAILLDAFSRAARGGTGHVIDWTIARATRELVPKLFLAGGISPDNVAEAITTVRPYAVDVCSSLERSPGRKDVALMRAFITAARSAS